MNTLDYIMSRLVIKTKIKRENIEIKNNKVIVLASFTTTCCFPWRSSALFV